MTVPSLVLLCNRIGFVAMEGTRPCDRFQTGIYFQSFTYLSWLTEAIIPVNGECAKAAIRPSCAWIGFLWLSAKLHSSSVCIRINTINCYLQKQWKVTTAPPTFSKSYPTRYFTRLGLMWSTTEEFHMKFMCTLACISNAQYFYIYFTGTSIYILLEL
jgi:hypothetical protein